MVRLSLLSSYSSPPPLRPQLGFSHQHFSKPKPHNPSSNHHTLLISIYNTNLSNQMPSSSTTKASKAYAPSVASTSSSTSYTKPSKSTETSSKRSAIINGAKRLLSDIGSPPTAAYDRQQAANGEQTDSQKAFYMPNQMPRRT